MTDGITIESQDGVQPRHILRWDHEASPLAQDTHEFAGDGVARAENEIREARIALINVGDRMDAIGSDVAAAWWIDGPIEKFAVFKARVLPVDPPVKIFFDCIRPPFR